MELADTQRRVHARGGQKKVDFYLRLRALGVFPADAPATIRAFGLAQGQLSIGELVDRYRLRCQPVRDLIVDYLRERQTALDYASLDAICAILAGLFWAQIEALSPGIGSLRLPPEVARTWKQDLQTKNDARPPAPGGELAEISTPRLNVKDGLLRVRAFYLDIAQWAAEDPARWAPWATPCPISDAEISRAKDRKHRKARMDQRTRERLSVLPVLVRTAAHRLAAAARRLQAARDTGPGALIPDTNATLRRAVTPKATEASRLGRRHRYRQAPQSQLRGRGSVLVLRRDRSSAPDRHPLRGTAGGRTVSHNVRCGFVVTSIHASIRLRHRRTGQGSRQPGPIRGRRADHLRRSDGRSYSYFFGRK